MIFIVLGSLLLSYTLITRVNVFLSLTVCLWFAAQCDCWAWPQWHEIMMCQAKPCLISANVMWSNVKHECIRAQTHSTHTSQRAPGCRSYSVSLADAAECWFILGCIPSLSDMQAHFWKVTGENNWRLFNSFLPSKGTGFIAGLFRHEDRLSCLFITSPESRPEVTMSLCVRNTDISSLAMLQMLLHSLLGKNLI